LIIESEDPRSVLGEGEAPRGAARREAEVRPWGGFGELVNLYALFHLEERLRAEAIVEDEPPGRSAGRGARWLASVFGTTHSPRGPEQGLLTREFPPPDPLPPSGKAAAETIVAHYLARAPAQPPRLESRPARKNYQSRLREELKELLFEGAPEVAWEPVVEDEASDGRWARLTLRSEAHARVSLQAWFPSETPAPAVIHLDPGRDNPAVDQALLPAEATCLEAGFSVVRLAARLSLEEVTEWGPLLRLLGRAPAAMAARDLRVAVDFVVRSGALGRHPIALIGHGPAGIAVLLAAAWDERTGAVVADCGGTTYRDGGDGLPRLPAILTVADVPQLASLAAPRPLWLYNVPPERTGFSSRRYFDWTQRTYQSLGASSALRLDTGPVPTPSSLGAWLQSTLRRR
jgi:hypothetical protein